MLSAKILTGTNQVRNIFCVKAEEDKDSYNMFKHIKGSKERLFIRTKTQSAILGGNPSFDSCVLDPVLER